MNTQHTHRLAIWEGAALAALAVVGTMVYGWVAAYSMDTHGFSDSIEYLFMADFYRAWLYGGQIADHASHYGATRYPPVFPITLAVFGAGSDHQDLAAVVSCALSAIAPFAVWLWLKKDGTQPRHAIWIAAALMLYPAYFVLNLNVVSEPLAMILLAMSFAILTDARLNPSKLMIASMMIGIALLARSALIPAVPALAIWLLFRRDVSGPTKLLAPAVAAAPLALWLTYRAALQSETYLDSVGFSRILAHTGGWPDALWTLPQRFASAILHNWEAGVGSITVVASIVLVALGATGCVIRLKRNKLDAWFLSGYIAMILVWPYPEELGRFLTVAYAGMLLCAVTAATKFDRWLSRKPDAKGFPAVQAILVGSILLVTLSTAVDFVRRAAVSVDQELLGEKREPFFFRAESDEEAVNSAEVVGRARFLAASMGQYVPSDNCVYAVFPAFVQLHGGVQSLPYPDGLSDSRVAEQHLSRCDYYFVVGFGVLQGETRKGYPSDALLDWTDPVLVSTITNESGKHTAAALLERRSPGVPGQ